MNEPVTLPLWLFVALVAAASWAILVLAAAPGMRWFFRRRINAVIRQVGASLQVELPSFKLTRRQVLIDRLFHDEKVQAAAQSQARAGGMSKAQIWRRLDGFAREIVPSFNAYLYFRIGYAIARGLARALYRVRIGYVDQEALARVDPKSTIVFVINHRSNMDYVLVAFLAAERTALSYAVGEWARIWPLQQLVRAMGAYFVRRNSGDPLYRAVLARYVQMAAEGGVTQAVFPEGGLTLDGRLRPPKLGLLDYMLKNFDGREGSAGRDLVFIPVGINYDRVLEDRTQLGKLAGSTRERVSSLRGLGLAAGFLARNLWQMAIGRWHRFGYACVNFGQPISLRSHVRSLSLHLPELSDEARHSQVAAFGELLMAGIGAVIPVLPVSLIASVLAADPARAWSALELKAQALARAQQLDARGAHLYLPRADMDYAFDVGLRMLELRNIVCEEAGLLRAVPGELPILNYYANAIAHLDS